MVHLVIDSTFGVKKDYIEQHNIKMVNLKLILGNETFDEGFEDTWESFYSKMKTSKILPSTSQPSPQDFINEIDDIITNDKDAEIIILTISNRLSGTINSATIASKNYKEGQVTAIDSKQATTCGRILVEELVELIENGATKNEVISKINELSPKLKIQFVPDNMDALKRGGRVTALSATIANILKIKPVFCFSDGKISVLKKVLGLGNSISCMISNIPTKLKKIYICYIHDKINVQKIHDKIKQVLNISGIEEVPLEPVFGVHVGIGSIGIATLEE